MTKPLMDQTLQSLDMRSRDIFRRIVDTYLKDGEPVGSRSLSRMLPSGLSPATIRNVMSDLEHLGLVYAPHVSAGRLPTQKGLRFFVDAFMELGDLSDEERRTIEAQIKASSNGATLEPALSNPWFASRIVFAPPSAPEMMRPSSSATGTPGHSGRCAVPNSIDESMCAICSGLPVAASADAHGACVWMIAHTSGRFR